MNCNMQSFRLFLIGLTVPLVLLSACTTEQVRMSSALAVLKTSAFSPDGKLVAGGRDIFNAVLLYDASNARFKKSLIGEDNSPSVRAESLTFSKDSKYLAAAGIDDMVVVWDLSNDNIILRLPTLKGALAVSFSPTEDVLAVSGPGNNVSLWKIPEGYQLGQLSGHSASVLALAFSPDGKMLATGSADQTARIWGISDLQQLKIFGEYKYPVHSVSFSADGSMLATYAGEIKIWEGKEALVQTLALPKSEPSSVNVAMGIFALIANGRSMQLGGGPLGVPLASAPDSIKMAISQRLPVIFSSDGKFLAILRFNRSWSGDYEIVLHNMIANTNKSIACHCHAISFSQDGTKLAVIGSFGLSDSLRILDPLTANWLDIDSKQ